MHNLKATIILFLLGGCLACHSKPSGHESAPAAQVPQQAGISTPQNPTTPQPTEVGMPLGDSVSKEIGPEGGSASSTDGHISVTIPAGVLHKRESIGIQEITNNAVGGTGKAFRLTPEGATFDKPVQLTFQYEDDELVGSAPELFGITYQDKNNFWHSAGEVTLDTNAKTVSVSTTHFSDWSKFLTVELLPKATVVQTGRIAKLTIRDCREEATGTTKPEDPIAPVALMCLPSPAMAEKVEQWAVNGVTNGSAAVGNVTATVPTAVYSAPANVPPGNPVAVSATYRTGKSKLMLVSNVTVIKPPDCKELREANSMEAQFQFSYSFSGKTPGGDTLKMSQSSEVKATLAKGRDSTPDLMVWRGSANGTGGLSDKYTLNVGNRESATVTLVGTGQDLYPALSNIVIEVHALNCAYNATVSTGIQSVRSDNGVPNHGNSGIGVVILGVRPVSGGLSGQAKVIASDKAPPLETDDRYNPAGLGESFIAQGFTTEEKSGGATVTWSFKPVK